MEKLFYASTLLEVAVTPVHKEYNAASGTNGYSVYYDYNLGRMKMAMNGTVLATTNFDPAIDWAAGWTSDFMGETHDGGDDVAGTATSKAVFSNIGIKTCRSCSYTAPTGYNTFKDSTRYDLTVDSATQVSIWTK